MSSWSRTILAEVSHHVTRTPDSSTDHPPDCPMTLSYVDHSDPMVRAEAARLTRLIIRHARVRRASRDMLPYFTYSTELESLPE